MLFGEVGVCLIFESDPKSKNDVLNYDGIWLRVSVLIVVTKKAKKRKLLNVQPLLRF